MQPALKALISEF